MEAGLAGRSVQEGGLASLHRPPTLIPIPVLDSPWERLRLGHCGLRDVRHTKGRRHADCGCDGKI